jgi:hypothetical protein
MWNPWRASHSHGVAPPWRVLASAGQEPSRWLRRKSFVEPDARLAATTVAPTPRGSRARLVHHARECVLDWQLIKQAREFLAVGRLAEVDDVGPRGVA